MNVIFIIKSVLFVVVYWHYLHPKRKFWVVVVVD